MICCNYSCFITQNQLLVHVTLGSMNNIVREQQQKKKLTIQKWVKKCLYLFRWQMLVIKKVYSGTKEVHNIIVARGYPYCQIAPYFQIWT